jgi:hypothetical protein
MKATIAAMTIAVGTVLAVNAANANDARESLERQGTEVCRQSLLRLAHINIDSTSDRQTFVALMTKDQKQMSLTERRIYVQAEAGFVTALTRGLRRWFYGGPTTVRKTLSRVATTH